MASGLTAKQQKFAEEYLKDFNATAAYKRAGYSPKNDNIAGVEAYRLLRKPKIQAFLAEARAEASERSKVTLERTLQETARIAFCDITEAVTFGPGGVALKNSEELPPEVTAAICSVNSTETENQFGTKRSFGIKLHSKMAALTLLADFYGIRNDFDQARATLKRYGLALVPDDTSATRWRVEPYCPSSHPDAL